MEQSFTEKIKTKFRDIEIVLNYQRQLCNDDTEMLNNQYYQRVMLIIDLFHSSISRDVDNYFDWYRQLMALNIPKLDIQDFIGLTRVTKIDFICMYYCFTFDTFHQLFTERQRIRLGKQFKRSDLKRDLMEKVWHPINFHKFKYWDPETFDF